MRGGVVTELSALKGRAWGGAGLIVRLHRTTMCSAVCCGTGGQLRPREEGKDKWIRKLGHGRYVQRVIFYVRYNNIQWK